MSPRIQTLRMLAKLFLRIHHGGIDIVITPEQAKVFADNCCIVLPMKYRFSKKELAELRAGRTS